MVFMYTKTSKEKIYSPNEVAKSFIVNNTLSEIQQCCLSNSWTHRKIKIHGGNNIKNWHEATSATASPNRIIFADWPEVCSFLGNIRNSRFATSKNFGWDLSSGSTKCSISASVNSRTLRRPWRGDIYRRKTQKEPVVIVSDEECARSRMTALSQQHKYWSRIPTVLRNRKCRVQNILSHSVKTWEGQMAVLGHHTQC